MQLPIDSKRARAHYVIENDGSLEETRRQVAASGKSSRKPGRIPGLAGWFKRLFDPLGHSGFTHTVTPAEAGVQYLWF